jgi:hypothetical protein
MKALLYKPARRKGSALLTVVFLVGVMAIITASMLKYTLNERRNNERQRLVLRGRNMAENISVYAAEQLTTKLMRLRSFTPKAFLGGSNEIHLPPDDVLTTNFSAPSGMEVRAGLRSSTSLAYVNPTVDPTNPNAGLHVRTSEVPIIAKATMTHPALGSVTAYCEHTMEIASVPLFQFGMFYNMDLELFPGQAMTIAGPVHTNGRLMARGEIGGSATVTFASRVTAAKGLYADGQVKANYRNRTGGFTSGSGGTGAVYYTKTPTTSAPNGTQINLYSGVWRDHKMGGSTETTTTLNQFKTAATSTYAGYVRTNVHGVTPLELPSVGAYKETDDPDTPEDDRQNGRELIEPVNGPRYDASASPVWQNSTDSAGLIQTKIAGRAGLYIVVNPDNERRIGKLPDGSDIALLPYTYRCFLNHMNDDGSHAIREVILPGQPYYGYDDKGNLIPSDDEMYTNNLPNRYTTNTEVGSNQILRIPEPGGRAWDDPDAAVATGTTGYPTSAVTVSFPNLDEGVFYDLRRATNWRGYPYERGTYNYTPRPIAKIDFDVARFKMCVNRTLAATSGLMLTTATTTTGYTVDRPPGTNWARSIFNPSGSPGTINHGLGASFTTYPNATNPTRQDPFRIYFAPTDPTDLSVTTTPSQYGAGGSDFVSGSAPAPWSDGISIYLHSIDAERRADGGDADTLPDRIDSGVRLWNGRGPVVSLAQEDKSGFTFVTNDALYIVGHFNAEGTVNTTSTATGSGGFSARWPDSSNEKLCAIMADAITIVSQPTFAVSGSDYYQAAGWNDSLSGHAADNGGELTRSASWRTSNPGSSNEVEGEGTGRKPGDMPYNSLPSGAAGYSNKTEKLATVNTEISAALLMGLVPSNHKASGLTDNPPNAVANQQYSGGAHNFPRLLEDWHNKYNDSSNNSVLCIRGSMVALFESRVAMEPWNIRCYLAPTRVWGLHEGFAAAGHHVPLEPILIGSRRMRYRELTAAQYAALKTEIEALPH